MDKYTFTISLEGNNIDRAKLQEIEKKFNNAINEVFDGRNPIFYSIVLREPDGFSSGRFL